MFIDWMSGVALVYSVLFGIGNLLLGNPALGIACFGGTALAAGMLWRRADSVIRK